MAALNKDAKLQSAWEEATIVDPELPPVWLMGTLVVRAGGCNVSLSWDLGPAMTLLTLDCLLLGSGLLLFCFCLFLALQSL